MDVHKETITISAYAEGSDELVFQQKIKNDPKKLQKVLKKLSKGHELHITYEAGGCGFVLARLLKQWGYDCLVAAPSLIPKKPGDRVKNDRRDSEKLARLLRSGDLDAVEIPSEIRESERGVVRCRYQIGREIAKTKDIIVKFLMARGYIYRDGVNFTLKHRAWLQKLDLPALDRYTLDSYLSKLAFLEAQQKELDEKIEELSKEQPYTSLLQLQALQGLGLYSTMLLLTEIGDFTRFPSPVQLMAYVGLTPSEDSTGDNKKQGPITKAGNSRCRKILVEAAWHYARSSRISKRFAESMVNLPPEIAEIVLKAHKRLCKKYQSLRLKKKPQVAVVAVARELVGFVWAIATKLQLGLATCKG
jgi:transposase